MVNQSTHFPADKRAGKSFLSLSPEAARVTRVMCVRACVCVCVCVSERVVEDLELQVPPEGVKDGVGQEMKKDRKRKHRLI